MRWTALVVLLLAGCGGDDAGDQAPDCDIPPKLCADGSGPVALQSGTGSTVVCRDASGDAVQQWSDYQGGIVTHAVPPVEQTACWSVDSTVAFRRRPDEAGVGVDECWDHDGEPADCAVVLEEINAASQTVD